MDGYDLAEEVFCNIGLNENHEISLNDTMFNIIEYYRRYFRYDKH